MFATPALALFSSFLIFAIVVIHIIHLNILISVHSSVITWFDDFKVDILYTLY